WETTAQFDNCVLRHALVKRVAEAEAAAVLAELPRQQAVALVRSIDCISEGHRLLGRERTPEWLNKDFDLPAAGQAYIERHLIADAVRDQARMVFLEHLLGVFDDV